MKRYPFSCERHSHDIEFMYNRTRNLMYDLERSDDPADCKEYNRLQIQAHELSDLLSTVLATRDGRGIAWISGQDYKLAKEAISWAAEERATPKSQPA